MGYAELAQEIATTSGLTMRDYHVDHTCAVVRGVPVERDGVLFANDNPGVHSVSVVVTGVPVV